MSDEAHTIITKISPVLSPTDLKTGLTDAEVATLRLQHGFNEVKEKQSPAIILGAYGMDAGSHGCHIFFTE
jgi:hypothetical protein